MKTRQMGPVDRLGIIKAKIAALEAAEEKARMAVIAMGNGPHAGALYDANVHDGCKVTLSVNDVRDKLGDLWVQRHSARTPYKVVSVTARRTRLPRRAA